MTNTRTTSNSEAREQSRKHKIGTNNPRCAACGIDDWRVIEEHHPDTRKRDTLVVLVCANDHRVLTDLQKDHPKELPGCDKKLASTGKFILGLADMLSVILDRLYDYGTELIELANKAASR